MDLGLKFNPPSGRHHCLYAFMARVAMAVILLIAGSSMTAAQLTRVTGQVFDRENDEPLPGVLVKVDGTQIAVNTDIDGHFTIVGADFTGKTISFTYTGYSTVTEKAAAEMKIFMSSRAELMDEVIVVAFGKQKRESFTGSASVVGSADLARSQVSNPVEALNGRVTGLQMTDNNSVSASSEPEIVVRGLGSINANTAPLIVLDGVPYTGYMADINTADVESITVLKDAASNALYGARGANGVILITTKNAQRGVTRVNLEAKWGANTNGRVKYDIIDNPGQYYEAHYMALRNNYLYKEGMTAQAAHAEANRVMRLDAGEGGLSYISYNVPEGQYLIGANGRLNPQATLGNRVAYNGQIYTLYPDDWEDAGTRNGLRQEYNLSITGGNDQFSMMATLGYLSNEGITYGSKMERITSRLKMNYQAYDFLRIGANASYTNNNSSATDYAFSMPYTVAPIYPLFIRDANGNIMTDANGKRYDYGNYDVGLLRPVEVNSNSIQDQLLSVSDNSTNAFSISGNAVADITPWLHLTVNGSVNIAENRIKNASSGFYGYEVALGGSTQIKHYRTTDTNFQQLLNFNKSFGVHNVDVLLGHEYSNWLRTYLSGSRQNLANYWANTELDGAIITTSNGSYKERYNVEGYFIRGQYDYDNRYFFSASFRRDGSSRFHPHHRWGNFWSIGAAWILTKEEWFPKSHLVNMLKLKASYGEQGNDGIGNFRYVDLYNISNSNDDVSFVFDEKGNSSITWETVGSFNAGFEFELFNSRLNGGVEFYYRKTRDMLMSLSVPYELGYASYYDNVGDMANTGIELELSGDVIKTRDFTWTLGMNLTWERNRVTYIPSDKAGRNIDGHKGYVDGSYYIGEGLPMYTYYIKKFAGVGENGEQLFYMTDKEGNLTTTSRYDSADYYLAGSPLPDVFGGFNTSIRVKDFDLNAQFNYSIGGEKYDNGYSKLMSAPTLSFTGSGIHKDVFEAWTPENTSSNIPMYYFNDINSTAYSDRFLTNASYLTFRNLSIGYTLPKSITKKIKMDRLRVYALCENVAYWTKRKGFDPRQSIQEARWGEYAPMRTISGGIQIQF